MNKKLQNWKIIKKKMKKSLKLSVNYSEIFNYKIMLNLIIVSIVFLKYFFYIKMYLYKYL
jgi:hypothetical protein